MRLVPYFWRCLLDILILLPLMGQVSFVCVGMIVVLLFGAIGDSSAVVGWSAVAVVALAFLALCFFRGRQMVVHRVPPDPGIISEMGCDRFFVRYQPIIFGFCYTLLIGIIAINRPILEDSAAFGPFVLVFGFAHFSSSAIFMFLNHFMVPSPWYYLAVPLGIYTAYGAGMALAFREMQVPRTSRVSMAVVTMVFLAALGVISWRAYEIRSSVVVGKWEHPYAEKKVLERYIPFSQDNLLVKVRQPGLVIRSDFPRLDGATAAYPIYAAAAEAIYVGVDSKEGMDLVDSSTTPKAYEKLIKGEVDVIFAAQPSAQQRADAEATGVKLSVTPIGREAFVFFVHKENPVRGLTTEQIRRIYTKSIRNWAEVGGANDKIVPFQRPAGSGSQTALEQKVMQGEKLPPPLREEFARGMGGIMQRVASYQNSREAIGYSFRFFATTMNPTEGIKLLEVDGVAPTRETIRSGAYPYTVELYAITAGTKNPHAKEFVDWFLTPAGQKLIDDTGYVSLPP